MNPQNMLNQFLGSGVGQSASQMAQGASAKVKNSGWAGVAGGVAAGGLLGLLVGNKKARKKVGKLAGGVAGYGGAAALGALAYRAYQNYQAGQQAPAAGQASHASAPAPMRADEPQDRVTLSAAGAAHVQTYTAAGTYAPPPAGSKFLPETAPASNGKPFELALVSAMIAAANADGHITPDEQSAIFEKVDAFPLDAEDKAFIFDMLRRPPSLQDIAQLAGCPEQAAELYLASRLAIDLDHPAERAYLDGLANRLSLPPALIQQLEAEVAGGA